MSEVAKANSLMFLCQLSWVRRVLVVLCKWDRAELSKTNTIMPQDCTVAKNNSCRQSPSHMGYSIQSEDLHKNKMALMHATIYMKIWWDNQWLNMGLSYIHQIWWIWKVWKNICSEIYYCCLHISLHPILGSWSSLKWATGTVCNN